MKVTWYWNKCKKTKIKKGLEEFVSQKGGMGGLPNGRGGDACRLAQDCNFQILVSLRVFWAKRHYILIAAKVSLGLHAKKYKIYIFQLYIRFIYSIHVIKV